MDNLTLAKVTLILLIKIPLSYRSANMFAEIRYRAKTKVLVCSTLVIEAFMSIVLRMQ